MVNLESVPSAWQFSAPTEPEESNLIHTGVRVYNPANPDGHEFCASTKSTPPEINRQLRQSLLEAACDTLGVRSFDELPKSVKAAFKVGIFKDDMKLDRFGNVTSTRPLTLRRILAVKAAVNMEVNKTRIADQISSIYARDYMSSEASKFKGLDHPDNLTFSNEALNYWMQYAQKHDICIGAPVYPPVCPQMGFQPQPMVVLEYVMPQQQYVMPEQQQYVMPEQQYSQPMNEGYDSVESGPFGIYNEAYDSANYAPSDIYDKEAQVLTSNQEELDRIAENSSQVNGNGYLQEG